MTTGAPKSHPLSVAERRALAREMNERRKALQAERKADRQARRLAKKAAAIPPAAPANPQPKEDHQMARGRKAGPSKAERRREASRTLDSEKFFGFVGDVAAARQELDDANMGHAGIFKRADALGIHPQAVKLFMRLDKMETTKRADFLRAFDLYRSWADEWIAQPDLLEEDSLAANETAGAARAPFDTDEETDPRVADLTETFAERAPVAAADPVQDGADADWGDEGAEDNDPALDGAGFTFAAGREAGLQDLPADQNPHAPESTSHPIWERGRQKGAAEREAASDAVEAAEAGDTDTDIGATEEPEAPSRRRRRAAANGADEPLAVLH